MFRWIAIGHLALSSLSITPMALCDDAGAPATTAVAAQMAKAANDFLDSLRPEQKALAAMAFDNPARLDWHWIPKQTRKGVRLGDLSSDQQALAERLIRSGLSKSGYEKSRSIRAMEAVLRVLENDTRGVRDPVKYYITIFGTPGSTGRWGWSCEGHHFSLNYAIAEGVVVDSTPTFFGANPRLTTKQVAGGPAVGSRLLGDEELLAFELAASLTEAQRHIALVNDLPTKALQTGPPSALYSGQPRGLSRGQMTTDQRAMLDKLLAAYSNSVPPAVAADRKTAIAQAGADGVHFYWMGQVDLDKPHYFCVHGPTFVVELDNVQTDPLKRPANHIHSVWRTPAVALGNRRS